MLGLEIMLEVLEHIFAKFVPASGRLLCLA